MSRRHSYDSECESRCQKDFGKTRCSDAEPASPTAPSVAPYVQHRFIWLQPWCDGCETYCASGEGRLWCQDDPWGQCDECGAPSVKYQLVPQPERVSPGSASNTDAPQQNTNDDNYFQQIHQSDKGISERSSDPTRGREQE